MNPAINTNLQKFVQSLPDPQRLKEVYVDLVWHQPGTTVHTSTILLVLVLVLGLVVVPSLLFYAYKK